MTTPPTLQRRQALALAAGGVLGLPAWAAPAAPKTALQASTQAARTVQVLRNLGPADGTGPQSTLLPAADGFLYGTSSFGGGTSDAQGYGTLFRQAPDGTGFRALHVFRAGADGANPYSGVIQASNGTLYGTTLYGGSAGQGTVYAFDPARRQGLTVLHAFGSFANDGINPQKSLVQGPDARLYGVTFGGGPLNRGTAFAIAQDGSMTQLHAFDGTLGRPLSPLVAGPDGALYGAAGWDGFPYVNGTIYRLWPDGTVETVYSFYNVDEGNMPNTLLLASDGLLYGTARGGGRSGQGTIFQVSTSGDFKVIYRFGRNAADGLWPTGLAEFSDGLLYGTLRLGGPLGGGTLFRCTRQGSMTALQAFSGSGAGPRYPSAGVVQGRQRRLYGTSEYGGDQGGGTVFRL